MENYEYEVPMDNSKNLADMDLAVIIESIKDQITSDDRNNDINYLSEFLSSINREISENADAPEYLKELQETKDSFLTEVISLISSQYRVYINIDNIIVDTDLEEATTIAYEYFVLGFRRNIRKFLMNYIEINKDSLVSAYEEQASKEIPNDVYKNKMDKSDIVILTMLPVIIDYIIDLNVPFDDFVDMSTDAEEYNASCIKEWIDGGKLNCDGAKSYIKSFTMDEYDLLDGIITNIKTYIIRTKMINQEV